MGHIIHLIGLARVALEFLGYYWPVTLALAVAVIVAGIVNCPFLRARFRFRHLLVFLPLAISVLILAWGTVMRHTSEQSRTPDWVGYVIVGLLALQLFTAIAVVYVLKSYRWFSAAAVLLEQWVALACGLVSFMSVTGDWL